MAKVPRSKTVPRLPAPASGRRGRSRTTPVIQPRAPGQAVEPQPPAASSSGTYPGRSRSRTPTGSHPPIPPPPGDSQTRGRLDPPRSSGTQPGPSVPAPVSHPATGPQTVVPSSDPTAAGDSMTGGAIVDPGSIPSVTRLATSPSLQTLPSVVPFRAPVRGDMIRNGSIGVYFMGEYIGGGSYGDVYECTDEWANPLVAKVLKPAMSFEEVRRQWESEVNNLSRMRHPNITYIYDAFFYDNAFYIIVEKCLYSLDRVLSRIDESWLPHIARDVLQALAFIHRHGHVHKDVHPGNVFVSLISDVMGSEHGPRVSFKLGDLGITRVETDIRIVGTIMAPWMLPPEAMDPATFGTVGRPTDVYHAALLLLSVLRRQVPQFTEAEILRGVPQRVAQSLHSPYSSALANALRPRVMHRTQTPLEFWREIQAALQYVGTGSG